MSKIPKKLTLKQAFNATSMPIARSGDLIIVQVFKELLNQPDFPNGEMRSIFMPSPDVKITENYLREIYNIGGWILSIADFSDEALALYYNYRAGHITASGWAGDAGDPSQFEIECRKQFMLSPNPTPEIRETVRRCILAGHTTYKLAADHGQKFKPGRDEGSITGTTSYIQQLVKSNPNLSAKELRSISDKSIIGNTLDVTFRNKVSAARNPCPKEKKAAK